jgi:hypothetical protein
MSLKGQVHRLAAVALGAMALIPVASADDLSPDARTGDRHLAAAPDLRIPQTAQSDADQTSSDILRRVEDLEATKTAINHGAGPAVSLSVSGWVSEQVTTTK